jgi:resuscitation-promoting factor RpfB
MHKKIRQLKRGAKRQKLSAQRFVKRYRKHPIVIPLLTFIGLTIITLGIVLSVNGGTPKFQPILAYDVIISHDHTEQTIPTKEPTVGALLNKLHITLSLGDVVEPSTNTPITQDNFRINIYRAVPVEIIEGSQTTFTFSAASTPRAIVQQAGIQIYPADGVSAVTVDNFVTQHTVAEQIVIVPATPVNLNIYGTPTVTRTHAKTVAQLLSETNIVLRKNDSVEPSVNTPITPNIQIFLTRSGTKISNVQQTIPIPVQTVLDDSLTFGTSAIRQNGSTGTEILTYQDNLENNVVVGQTLIQTIITQPAIPEIIARGQAVQIPADKTAVMAEAGISTADYPYVNYIVSNESGWCPTKLQGEIGYCPGYAPSSFPDYLGYGLGQATPGTKMASFGSDWETNPVTQLRWATSYALGRYGSWAAAYNFWQAHHYW